MIPEVWQMPRRSTTFTPGTNARKNGISRTSGRGLHFCAILYSNLLTDQILTAWSSWSSRWKGPIWRTRQTRTSRSGRCARIFRPNWTKRSEWSPRNAWKVLHWRRVEGNNNNCFERFSHSFRFYSKFIFFIENRIYERIVAKIQRLYTFPIKMFFIALYVENRSTRTAWKTWKIKNWSAGATRYQFNQ